MAVGMSVGKGATACAFWRVRDPRTRRWSRGAFGDTIAGMKTHSTLALLSVLAVAACSSESDGGGASGGAAGGESIGSATGAASSGGSQGGEATGGTASGGSASGGTPAVEGPGPGSESTYQDVAGVVSVEAEHFNSYDQKGAPRAYTYTSVDFTSGIMPDPDENHSEGASGGVYLETLPDTRVTHDDPIKEGESIFNKAGTGPTLSYTVNFSEAGTYYVWVRAYSTGGEDNGIHVGINDEFPESGQKLQFCKGKNQWTWSSAKRDSGGSACGEPHTITIEVPSAGQHTIQFSMREDGFEFDKWVMSSDAEYVPEGEGPEETVSQ